MKKLIIILIAALTIFSLIGCEGFIKPTSVTNPICPKEGSFLCAQSEKMGIQLETTYGFIYSAAAIAAISDKISIKEICDFEQKIADLYVELYPLSYSSFISKVAYEAGVIKDSKKSKLIMNILNKNLVLYHNDSLISKADDEILRMGHSQFRSDMMCD